MLSLIKYYLRTAILLFVFFTICNGLVYASISFKDTIPLSTTYSGYRIELIDFKTTNKTNDKISGTVTLVNSGKYPVSLGAFGFKTAKLKVLFDTDLDQKSKEAIITKIITTQISLDPGDMLKNIAVDADLINYKSKWSSANASEAVSAPTKQMPAKVNADNIDTKPVVKENPVVAPVIKESVSIESSTDKKCPDLIISKITIIKKSKKHLQLEYTLTNQGNEAAQLYNKKTKEYVAIAAYFSASGKLSRGSIVVGGDVIEKGLEKSDGQLLPGSSYSNKINIDLSSRSRYLNTLILSADSRQVIYECVENNNNASILVD